MNEFINNVHKPLELDPDSEFVQAAKRSTTPILDAVTDGIRLDLANCDFANLEERYLAHHADALMEDLLPHWAERKATPQVIEPMLQLFTLDSRARGNATVTKVEVRTHRLTADTYIQAVTDAGNYMVLTPDELLGMYELGDYILKDLPNPKCSL